MFMNKLRDGDALNNAPNIEDRAGGIHEGLNTSLDCVDGAKIGMLAAFEVVAEFDCVLKHIFTWLILELAILKCKKQGPVTVEGTILNSSHKDHPNNWTLVIVFSTLGEQLGSGETELRM